jgi:DNA processing protein
MFPARNRIIAALAAMTVVVEAGTESGALLTAGWARELGRPVGAVPGRVTNRAASGSNALLAGGAHLIRDAQDVLDHLYGIGERPVAPQTRPCLPDDLVAVLTAIEQGRDTAGALEQTGFATDRLLAALTSLELAGYVRRAPGGRFIVTA